MKNKSVSWTIIFATASVVSVFIMAAYAVAITACGSDNKKIYIILAIGLALVGLKEAIALRKMLKKEGESL
jgi:uncharacterized membrane protein